MVSVCFYFQVHQPVRAGFFNPQESGSVDSSALHDKYFIEPLNRQIFEKVAGKCYYPATRLMLELVDRYKSEKKPFKISYSITGTWLEQCEKYAPDLLDIFRQMSATGCVEFLDETYYHSLSSLYEDKGEFVEQVREHRQAIKGFLGYTPTFFRNTECIYNNSVARVVSEMGYSGMFTEGIDWILNGWRSPNFVYKSPAHSGNLPVLLRNYRLSDDVGYRFSARNFDQWPVTADKYASWLASSTGQSINICMDYETFGEHQWEDTGIFLFLRHLPQEIYRHEHLEFSTPSEVVAKYKPVGDVDVFEFSTISWADMERDVSAWLGNDMQRYCFEEIKHLEKYVKAAGDSHLLKIWRMLQTSDHYYYLCTKYWGDGDVHHYFSHVKDQRKAFFNFLGIISDLKNRVFTELAAQRKTAVHRSAPGKKESAEEVLDIPTTNERMISFFREQKSRLDRKELDYKSIKMDIDRAVGEIESMKKLPKETINTLLHKLDPAKHSAFIRVLKIWENSETPIHA